MNWSGRVTGRPVSFVRGRRWSGHDPTSASRASARCWVVNLAVAEWVIRRRPTPTRPSRAPQFLAFCRYLRSLYPPAVRLAIVCDNFSPHLSTRTDSRVGEWAAANNVEIAYTPFYGSWLNRIKPQFTALRYFTLDGTDHETHREQARMIRRYIAWPNGHTTDPTLGR